MKTSNNGKNKIKGFEGTRLVAYLCSAGVPTIGTGHTHGVKMGDVITQEQADQYLTDDLAYFENGVNHLVKVPLTQNQFDAIISLVFNIGVTAFKNSTLLRKLNASDYMGASNEFPRWNKGGGKVLSGLVKRRQAEKELFDKA